MDNPTLIGYDAVTVALVIDIIVITYIIQILCVNLLYCWWIMYYPAPLMELFITPISLDMVVLSTQFVPVTDTYLLN